MTQPRHTIRGFTIVEILVAMTIFAMSILTITSLFIATQISQQNNRYYALATYAVRSEVERLHTKDFYTIANPMTFSSDLLNDLPQSPAPVGTVTVGTDSNIPNAKTIVVSVTYTQPSGGQRTVSLKTVVNPPEEI